MCWFFFRKTYKYVNVSISRERYGADDQNRFPWKTRIYLCYTIYPMAADVLAMEGTFENIIFKMSSIGCNVLHNMIIGHSGWIIYVHSSCSYLGHTRHIVMQVKSYPPDKIIIISGILKLCLTFKSVLLSTANPLPCGYSKFWWQNSPSTDHAILPVLQGWVDCYTVLTWWL